MDIMTLFLAVIVILIFTVFALLAFLMRKTKKHREAIEQFEIEAVASLEKVEKDLEKQKEHWLDKAREDYQAKIEGFKEYVNGVEKISRTASEIKTHTNLMEMKERMVSKGLITPSEMKVVSNVFLPVLAANQAIQPAKIDHIVLMKTGIYIIDTVEIDGEILYGMTMEKAKEFSFVLDHLFRGGEKSGERTIVVEADHIGEIKMKPIDNPAVKVMQDVDLVKQALDTQVDYFSLTPILYFDPEAAQLRNFSEQSIPYVFNDKKTFEGFFASQLERGGSLHTEIELERIKKIIEQANLN
ncbi:nuclease-related domain-containing protein [Bacillus sp. REN3]|uniref:nuclease-related domain-containing protein n=1 Tax=Bacillus sp. REN3 TaxID=2802440 RepID=UPI001AEE968C|nr:nuclease-related domain-containing protein [Bacillus sp. REN3]